MAHTGYTYLALAGDIVASEMLEVKLTAVAMTYDTVAEALRTFIASASGRAAFKAVGMAWLSIVRLTCPRLTRPR